MEDPVEVFGENKDHGKLPEIIFAMLLAHDGETGVHTHVHLFSSWLKKNGYPNSVVTPFDAPKAFYYPVFALRKFLSPFNRPLSVWWYRKWHQFFLQYVLKRRLKSGVPFVVYAQCPLSAQAALDVRISSHQQVVLVTHFNISQADEWADKGDIPLSGVLYNSIRQTEKLIFRRIDRLVFVSNFMRESLFSTSPELKNIRSEVIPNFTLKPGQGHFKEKKRDLITIGTLEPRKNHRYALEILAAARKLGYRLTLTIVGRGPMRRELENIAQSLGVCEYVIFTGYIPNAAEMIAAHRAYLHVAKMESFGIVLIEAMSSGVPVFAPMAGGMTELFSDDREGRFIPVDDSELAAKRILEWMSSEDLLEQAGERALATFHRHYTIDIVAPKLVKYLL